jgi:type IV secretion system protein VirB11
MWRKSGSPGTNTTWCADSLRSEKNLFIGGRTGSGKPTFTNAILKKMVEYTPNDRF